uniref:Zonadhesin n=1 Tax=Panagrellus redivivus TaxID=6233 RepID=A0A7E4UY08_PANRE
MDIYDSTAAVGTTFLPPKEQAKTTFNVYGQRITDAQPSIVQTGSTLKPEKIELNSSTVKNGASTDVPKPTIFIDTTIKPTEYKANADLSTSEIEATLSTPTEHTKSTFDVYGQRTTDALPSTVQSGATLKPEKIEDTSTVKNGASTDVPKPTISIDNTIQPTEYKANDGLSTSVVEATLPTTTEDDALLSISKNNSISELIKRNMTIGNNTVLLDIKQEPPMLNKIYNSAEGLIMEFTHNVRVLLSPVFGNTTVH